MVGIPLSQQQRSALLQSLLQQRPQRRPITGIGALGQAGSQIANAFTARAIAQQGQEQQAQQKQQQQAQLNTLAQSLAGRSAAEQPASDAFSQTLRGSLDNPILAAAAQQGLTQRIGGGGGQGFTLSPGQTRFGPGGQQIAQAPPEPQQPGFEGTGLNAQAFNTLIGVREGRIDPNDPQAQAARQILDRPTTVATPQGTFVQPGFDTEGFLQGQVSAPRVAGRTDGAAGFFPKEPTERERTSAAVAGGLISLEGNVQDVFQRIPDFNPSDLSEAKGNLPVLGNILASPGFRQYRAASDEWATGLVFLRSGATARQEEKDSSFKNMWPQPGDDLQTQTFKELLRKQKEVEALNLGARANRISNKDADKQIESINGDIQRLEEKLNTQQPGNVSQIDQAIQDIDRQIEEARRKAGGN